MYDVIVVGARAGGASTAMLLARRGLKVLCVDKASFPSDTLSTHQIQLPGVAKLKRWGLLDAVAASTPPTREVRFDTGKIMLEGRFPPFDGVDAIYGPRRTVLDKIMVDAARRSGAELREDFLVEDLVSTDGRVTGVRGRAGSAAAVVETAPLVIGADGKGSLIAKSVGTRSYFEQPVLAAAYYAYWDGLNLSRGELYERHRRTIGVWPTSDGLTVIYLGLPIVDFATFRSDVAGNFFASLDLAGDLAARVRAARQVGRFMGSANLPNRFRKPFGPGWALVGDAGLVMDPLTGQGIGHAFRDAELLADAIEAGLRGTSNLQKTLRAYETERNRQSLPMYKMTTQQAAMGPRGCEFDMLYQSLQGRQPEIDKFFAVLTGTMSMKEFLSPTQLLRVLGVRGMARISVGKMREQLGRGRRDAAAADAVRIGG
jgi:2-polyprenyl-6-methoxyphenol hydroxylase-like FAD-dependent oxidoreductase